MLPSSRGVGLCCDAGRRRTTTSSLSSKVIVIASPFFQFNLTVITTTDPDNLLVMLDTWQRGDVSKYTYDGNLEAAIASIKARALILPCQTDLYFPPEDNFVELASFSVQGRASVVPIPSIWGHAAGGQANPEDQAWVIQRIKEFLETA